MATTYGIISDMHDIDVRALFTIIRILKDEEVDALVLNGDIVGNGSQISRQDYFANALNICAESSMPVYVVRGSHETLEDCEPVIEYMKSKHQNLIDTLQNPKIEVNGHHLVFISGSDSHPGKVGENGYHIIDNGPTGLYRTEKNNQIYITNPNDLKRLVTAPEKTIFFSHIPRRFHNLKKAVDCAEFYTAAISFPIQDTFIQAGSIFPKSTGERLVNMGIPLTYKSENVGNISIEQICQELGIQKHITGHIHESAGNAHDESGNPVEASTFVTSLFYNASCMDRRLVGLVSIDESKGAYETIDLFQYIKEHSKEKSEELPEK